MAIDPMTALSIGQSVLGFMDASRAARDQENRYLQNRMNAAQARDLQIQQLNRRAIQEAERSTGMKMDNAIAALEVAERKVVASGEAGVGGQGLEQQLAMTEARRLRNNTLYNSQLKGTLDQLELEKMGVDAQAQNRINSLKRGVQPSFLRMAVGTAASAYSTELKYAGNKSGSFLDSIGFGGTYQGLNSTPLPPVQSMT